MTLFRQMALLTSLFMIITLITVLGLNFKTANEQMQEQLYNDAQNTAASLSLTLGTALGDTAMMRTMINANFDSGHYEKIALLDRNGTVIYERHTEPNRADVPQWFVDLVPIHTPIATAQVSSGWSPIGILHVQSDNIHAYTQLYSIFTDLLLWFSIIAAIALLILSMALHLFLRPLKKVQEQAEAVGKHHFIIQEELPSIVEFREVVATMNTMVGKVKTIFDKGNDALKRNQELLYRDPVTKLYNRRYLMLKLPNLLSHQSDYFGGSSLFIALHDAKRINQILGHQKADAFFYRLAQLLLQSVQHLHDTLVSRTSGTEFAVIVPNCDRNGALAIATALQKNISVQLCQTFELNTSVCRLCIGIYPYDTTPSVQEFLTRSDYALTQAKALKEGAIYMYEPHDDKSAMGKEQWRRIIEEAMHSDSFKLKFWPVVNTLTTHEVQRVLTFSINDHNRHHYSYGNFIAPALSLGLVQKIYMYILKQLFQNPPKPQHGMIYTIRLSSDFLKTPRAYEAMQKLFEQYAGKLHIDLVFELSDAIILQHLEIVKSFALLFEQYGYTVGINEFTGASEDYAYLKEIRPRFIKADVTFYRDLSTGSMNALHIVADSLGISLMATGVDTQDEALALKSVDIQTVQGPYAEKLLTHT